MNRILLLFCFLYFVSPALAQNQEYPAHAQTIAPPTSRFEVVQSHLAVKWTFLLDKFTGKVKQLVKTKTDELAWEEMLVIGLPKSLPDGKVRYQIFSSGIAARNTFLLNVDTGQTWVITSFKDEKLGESIVWSPFEY